MDPRLLARTASALSRAIISLVLTITCAGAFAGEVTTAMDQFMIKRGYTVVPLRVRMNHLYANAKINGERAVGMVDTGATDLILDTRRTGGLKSLGKADDAGYGIFGKFASGLPIVRVDRFEMSGVVFSNQPALVTSLRRQAVAHTGSYIPSAPQHEEYDCLIGLSQLRNMHALLDCYAPRLYVRPEKPDPAVAQGLEQSFRASGFARVTAKLMHSKLFVGALLNDQPALFAVDTGSFGTTIAFDQLEAFHLSNKETLGRLVDLGGKTSDMRYARPESLKLGAVELKNYPVITEHMPLVTEHNAELKKSGLPPIVGFLGPEILNKTRALVDCDGGRLFLMPEKTP